MTRYLNYSLILHAALFLLLASWTFLSPREKPKNMQFVILPKGTSLDAVLTKEVEEAMKHPKTDPASPAPPSPSPGATPPPAPSATPEAAGASPTPSPTPIKLETPTPAVTPAPSAVPEKTIAVAPKGTPEPTPTPKPDPTKTPTPKPKPSATPKKATPTPNAKKTPNTNTGKEAAKKTPKSAKKTPKPTPVVVASAYDITPKSGDNRFDGVELPSQTPSNVTAREAAPGQEVGVPGVPEGVEGAPLPLDRNQSMLSMLYTTRARMRIQSNFTVPPGVDDPNLTCIVEWEILKDGTIQNIKVTKSTGVPQYDSCAVDALRRAESLGPLPPEFGDRSVWTSLTFVYAGDQGAIAPPPPAP